MTDEQRREIHEAMVRLAQGHRDAFSVVFDGLWPNVLRFVQRAIPGHADVEDLAQRTLLKIFARISDFDTDRDGVAWALGIAGYEVKTLRRQVQRRRETAAEAAIGVATPARSPEDIVIEHDLHAALAATLGELTVGDRTALVEDAPDISSAISPAAWRKRRQRALERLRTAWRKRHA